MMKNRSMKMKKTLEQNTMKTRQGRNVVVLPMECEKERMENRRFSVEREGGSRMNVKKENEREILKLCLFLSTV